MGLTARSHYAPVTPFVQATISQSLQGNKAPLPRRAGWRISVLPKMKPPDFSKELNRLMDPYWRKARIAARLLIKREDGQPWSARDRRLAERLSRDPGVTNRLLDQAYSSRQARRKYGPGILGWFN